MVIPRSFSRSMESRNWAVISRWVRAPVRSISRSDRVVFPWSMWAMIEKLRMWSMGPGSAILVRPAHHHDVQARPAEEEPAALRVQPVGLVQAEQPVGQDLQQREGLRPQGLGLRAGHHQGHTAVDEGQEELVLVPVLEDVVHGRAVGQGLGDGEEGGALLLEETAKGPGLAVLGLRALEEDSLGLHHARVAAPGEPADGLQELQDLGREPPRRLKHTSPDRIMSRRALPPRREAVEPRWVAW